MMKKILLFSLVLVSCANAPAIVPTLFSCVSAQSAQIIDGLMTGLIDILATANFEAALSGLAISLGPDGIAIINCTIQKYLSSPKALTSDTYDVARTHGAIWLQEHSK